MYIVWDCSKWVERCEGHDDHYWCEGDSVCRPANFPAVREQILLRGLDEIWLKLLDYLEANPDAWLSYG